MNKRMHISNGNKRILQIAVPSIISNITVPLLGLVDVTIVGHLGSAAYIGAIAVGGCSTSFTGYSAFYGWAPAA